MFLIVWSFLLGNFICTRRAVALRLRIVVEHNSVVRFFVGENVATIHAGDNGSLRDFLLQALAAARYRAFGVVAVQPAAAMPDRLGHLGLVLPIEEFETFEEGLLT